MSCIKIKQLDIRLAKDYFYPGELIEGKLVIDVLEEFSLNAIHLLVRGKAHCEWNVFISGDRRIIKDDQYFIDERTVIWNCVTEEEQQGEDLEDGKAVDGGEERSPPPPAGLVKFGIHEFHFSFRLPDSNVPCSLESRACSIRYYLRVILDVPSTVEIPQGVKYFTMIPTIDCNDNKYLNPLFGSEKRWKSCFCCRQQTASLRCILERNAYCSGETIKLKSFIQNYTTETVKLKVRLVQFCEFNAQKANLCGVTKEVQHLVLEYTSDEIMTNEDLELTTSHCLPILPPSIVGISRLVQLYYTLTVNLEFELSGQDLQMLFPIKIGTKPFNGHDYKIEYGPCCDHVEGGIYVDPEFARGNRFWDDGDEEEATPPGHDPQPLYRPVYLKVVRITSSHNMPPAAASELIT